MGWETCHRLVSTIPGHPCWHLWQGEVVGMWRHLVGWGKKGYTLGEGCTKVLASTLHHLRHHVTHTITSLNTYNHTRWYLHSKDDLLRLYKRLLCCLYQDHSFPPSNTPYNSYTRALLHLSESHLVSISVPCLTESVSWQTVGFPLFLKYPAKCHKTQRNPPPLPTSVHCPLPPWKYNSQTKHHVTHRYKHWLPANPNVSRTTCHLP